MPFSHIGRLEQPQFLSAEDVDSALMWRKIYLPLWIKTTVLYFCRQGDGHAILVGIWAKTHQELLLALGGSTKLLPFRVSRHTPAPQLDWVRQCLIEIHEFWLRGERRPIAVQSGDPIALLANTCVSLIKGSLLWFPSTQSQDLKVIYHPIGLHMSNAAVKYH